MVSEIEEQEDLLRSTQALQSKVVMLILEAPIWNSSMGPPNLFCSLGTRQGLLLFFGY